jgi:RNA polymerase sigma-70 factor, ECF subfamily
MTEQELVKELVACNQKAYRELAERYQTTIIRTCHSLVHDHHDAEDLAQEVFLEVFRSITRFKGNSGLGTWLYRIAVNKSLNFVRGNKKRAVFERIENIFIGKKEADLFIASTPGDSKEIEEKENTQRITLYRALDALPKNQRIAFVLHKYDELPYREISEVMKLSLSSIESLIHRAKKNLQNNIAFYDQNKRT